MNGVSKIPFLVLLFAGSMVGTSIGEVSTEFLDLTRKLWSEPTAERLVEFGMYLRSQGASLTLEERDRANRVISQSLGSLREDEIPPVLEKLNGVRSAAPIRFALGLRRRDPAFAGLFENLLNSSPEAVIDFSISSFEGSKFDPEIVREMSFAGVESLIRAVNTSNDSKFREHGTSLVLRILNERSGDFDSAMKRSLLDQMLMGSASLAPHERTAAESRIALASIELLPTENPWTESLSFRVFIVVGALASLVAVLAAFTRRSILSKSK